MENGTVHIETNTEMHGLPRAGLLANELLEKRLNKRGYFQSELEPRIVETKVDTGALHTSSRWFWSEICGQKIQLASERHAERELQAESRLVKQGIHRNNIGLGLQMKKSTLVNAKKSQENDETISAHIE